MENFHLFNLQSKDAEKKNLSPSQSWIEDNLHSIIQNNDDEEILKFLTPKLQIEKKDDSVEKPRELMITPKNPLFKANPLKRSAVSPVTVPETLGLFQKLNNSDSNMFNNLEYNQKTPPSIFNKEIDVAPSPPFKITEIESEQPHQQYQSYQKTNFLNVLKTLDNEFKTTYVESKIFRPSSALFQENENLISTELFSQKSSSPSDLLNSTCIGGDDIRSSNQQQSPIVLHVKNLDYKISADEWRRILTENFKKQCKDLVSVNVVMNADKSLLGVVKLGNKDDVKLAISSLHHKKIGYKRLNVAVALTPITNSPKSRVVSLLRSMETQEIALSVFIEKFELRYNQTITVSELIKLRDVISIVYNKDGQGRLIKLSNKAQNHNLYNEMKELMHTPYCVLHVNNKQPSGVTTWLPNVIVSLRSFKPLVHKLLNDHGGQMPLYSFLDCYKALFFNEPNKNNHHQQQQLIIIDDDNGVPLEHLATCAQDVVINLNEGVFKQLQWDNDKTKHVLPPRYKGYCDLSIFNSGGSVATGDQENSTIYEFDESIEESQRKKNQFSHEVVELFKTLPRSSLALSKFSVEYHKKFGRQCRVADYGFTKLCDLIESIPHVLQILGSEFDKKLTLTHRVQVRRFSNDLIKVLKAHSSKQMFADEYPNAFEKHFGKQFDIRDYGVCYLEDMLAELPESTISRKEIDNRTFIQIPKPVQTEEEKVSTQRLSIEIIDMLKHKPRFSIQFNKFIPNFHHHFGRQLKLANYGFTKLIDLLEAMPDVVNMFFKDGFQFVQLKKDIMLDLICKNILNLTEMNKEPKFDSLFHFESTYNSIFNNTICYNDFGCTNIVELVKTLDFSKYFMSLNYLKNYQVSFNCETIDQKEADRLAKVCLKRLFEDKDEVLTNIIKLKKSICFNDILNSNINLLDLTKTDLNFYSNFNRRTKSYFIKLLIDYFKVEEKNSQIIDNGDFLINGLSDLYKFSKQLRTCYLKTNNFEMTFHDLELLHSKFYSKDKMTPKKLGYIDLSLLISQGLSLIFVSKKHIERRVIFLKKEFWPQDSINTLSSLAHQVSTPQSPIYHHNQHRQQHFTPTTYNNF